MMKKRTWLQWAAGMACGGQGRCAPAQPSHGSSAPVLAQLTVVVPASPGGGMDQTGRAMGAALQSAGLVGQVRYENLPGQAGVTGLLAFADRYKGQPDALLMTGMFMLGGIAMHRPRVELQHLNPVAQLTSDYLVIAVPASSPLKTIQDLAAKLRDPQYRATVVGGSAGSSDHILLGMMLRSVQASPDHFTYLSTTGGGLARKALLNQQADWGISGYSEWADAIQSGQIRPLAISSQHRELGLPSLRDSGIMTNLVNWRGVCAPNGLNPAQLETLQALIDRVVTTPFWRETVKANRWLATYRPATSFRRFLETEQATARVVISLLKLNSR